MNEFRVPRGRLVPLIIACGLFMENLGFDRC